tara:strand:+ start:16390 stop:17991 length:1602 start_codon:yes stop_codon:yes gene_type:complete
MIKILDCTLRDGGYYTGWDFEENLVQKYLNSVSKTSIELIELGFRFPKGISQKGPFAYSLDSYIDNLNLPEKQEYCVMINAADYTDIDLKDFQTLSSTKERKSSRISLIRIAVNFDDFRIAKSQAFFLNSLGYKVAINLMQSHSKEETLYKKVAEEINNWGVVEILYFADSFGVMNENEVLNIIKLLKKGWKGELGFHSHNNLGKALINSITAAKNGINWIDSTICGMGRGAGNASTKPLIKNLNKLKLYNGDHTQLDSIEDDFTSLKNQFNWGANQYYRFAALNSIHPTYVQNLLTENRYSSKEIKQTLKNLSEMGSSKYDPDKLISAFYVEKKSKPQGKWNASGWLKGQEVILLGPGVSISRGKDKIMKFTEENKLKVIFLNKNHNFPDNYAFTTVISNIDRAMVDLILLEDSKSSFVLPYERLKNFLGKRSKDLILDYGLVLEDDEFESNDNYCTLFTQNVSAYALALMYQAGVKRIYFAGLDGYPVGDKRNQVMEKIFSKFKKLKESPEIISITKTYYKGLAYKDISKI